MPQDEFDRLNEADNIAPVRLPSGGAHFVHEREVTYFNERRDRYLSDNHFTNVSDFQDLDRLLVNEVLVQRYGTWLSQNRDYWNEPIDETRAQRAIKELSGIIHQVKKTLGLDKETRDKVRGEDSVDAYIRNLRQRAREFGILRNMQAAKAIELFQEISGVVTLYEKCDDIERVQQHCTPDEILKWFIETVRPEFDAIDAEFRKTTQKYWIREQ